MPPERSGIADYSALLLPELSDAERVVVVRRARKQPPRGTDVCLYHVGNNPDAHGWIVEALRRTPGVVVLHDFVLHHLVAGLTIGRRDGHGYLDAMEREGGVVGRLLGHAVLDKRIPPLWENRPEDFHLAGEVLALATGLIVHSRYVRDRARAAGYERADLGRPASGLAGARRRGPSGRGRAALRHVRQHQRDASASRSSSRRSPACARRIRPAKLLLVGATSPGFDLDRRLQRLGLDAAGSSARATSTSERLWALMAAADVRRHPAVADDGGDLGHRDPGAHARQAARRQRRRLVLGAARTSRAEGSRRRRRRSTRWPRRSSCSRRARTCAHAMGAAALELAAAGARRRPGRRPLRRRARAGGGRRAPFRRLSSRDVSRAAAEVGIEPGAAEATRSRRGSAEVELGG